jgi:Cyclin, N-terminal domain
MVLGRHRTVMVGDRVTGPIITSTIQFVEPSLLKAELNKQFRERFDGWEPPRSARRYIGARVLDGVYTLMDPGAADAADDRSTRTPRQGSVASVSTASVDTKGGGKEKQIRMPPSLTLSKIRSLKNQALTAALKANLEIGTVALACVYFERLCLDCRVDKSNRKLSMAACLLLASKINEPNIALVDAGEADNGRSGKASDAQPTAAAAGGAVSTSAATTNNSATPNTNNVAAKIQSVVRSTRRSNTMYASLLEFFTEDWSLSLKHLFAAEWGVFAALGFSLLAEPSQTAFHFRRLMKTLELNPRAYLGDEMYEQWQASLVEEEVRRQERERRRELRRQRKEQELLNLHLELENDRLRRKIEEDEDLSALGVNDDMIPVSSHAGDALHAKATDASPGKVRKPGIGFLHRLGMRRTASSEAVNLLAHSEHQPRLSTVSGAGVRRNSAKDTNGLPHSPSMPIIANVYLQNPGTFAIDFSRENPGAPSETSSIGSVGGKGTTIGSADEKEEGAIVV